MRKYPTPAEALIAFVLASAVPTAADPAVPAVLQPPGQASQQASQLAALQLNQTLDTFHPTPRQTIALRDFLGGRGERPFALGMQPNGLFLFDLRDAANQRTGQFAVGADAGEGSIFLARVSGPATFDMTRRAAPPRLVNSKMRGAVSALLTATLASGPYEAATGHGRDMFLHDRPMLALTLGPIAAPDRVIQTEASYFPDGSGFARLLRAPVGMSAALPIHVGVKYYPALEGDGRKAFRAAVLGVDADFIATLADFGNKVPCPPAGCASPPIPVSLKGDAHLTRWPHAIVPSAPPGLIAQISPPPVLPPLPDILNDNAPQPVR